MRVLVTGAKGMLGSDVCAAFRNAGHDVVATARQAEKGFVALDITDLSAARAVLGLYSPDVVVHCAAFANVDACEREPDKAMLVNGTSAATMAAAAEGVGAGFVYI